MPSAPETPVRLKAQQYGFAAHLRDPQRHAPPPGIEERRLRIYRELFYNNVESLLASNFPVIRGLLGDNPWHALVRAFYRDYRCHTPLFPEVGREFLRYLEQRHPHGETDPPFLLELAHYEWIELALAIDETNLADVPHDPQGDLLTQVPVPSPLAWPLAYSWPVQQLRADYQPERPPEQATFLLLLRDRHDRVQFKAIDALGFQLMQMLHANETGANGSELLHLLATQLAVPDLQTFISAGTRLLQQLRERDAVLGTRLAKPKS